MFAYRIADSRHPIFDISVPDDVLIETVTTTNVPGWDGEDMTASRSFGDSWIRENRSAVLRVPSVITQGRESNIVFNPLHAQFALISIREPEPVLWDKRLFR